MKTYSPLVQEILKAQADHQLAIVSWNQYAITTDDFDLDRYISYRLVQPSANWYARRIHFVSPEARRMAGHLKQRLVSLLLSLEPEMTQTLSGIYIVNGADDSEALCALTDVELDELPDCVMAGEPDDCLGCLWGTQQAIIIDVRAIQTAVHNLRLEPWENSRVEFDKGVFTTLTHEVYHLASANPFLILPSDDEEAAAEAYGLKAYHDWLYHA